MDTIGSLCFVNPLESTVPRKYSGGLDFPKILLFKSKGPYGEGILKFPSTCPAKWKNRSRPRKTVWKGRISLSSYVLLRRTCQPSNQRYVLRDHPRCLPLNGTLRLWQFGTDDGDGTDAVLAAKYCKLCSATGGVALQILPHPYPSHAPPPIYPRCYLADPSPCAHRAAKNAAGERERIKRSFKLKKWES